MSRERSGENTMDQARLKELLRYCPDTGAFTWKVSHARAPAGGVAGCADAYGYVVVRADKVLYKAHRLAWLYVHGNWPTRCVDHINGVRNDNRISNLRDVNQSVNMHNARRQRVGPSGVVGVTWDAARGKWKAQIRVMYKNTVLGRFVSKADAIAARKQAELWINFRG